MDKKLVKTRNRRTNTLEAMTPACVCVICKNCSGGGSFQEIEKTNNIFVNALGYPKTKIG